MQPCDQVNIDRLQRTVQRPENRTTDPLTECSKNLEATVTEGNRELLSRLRASYAVRFVTESTVTIVEDGVSITVSADRMIEIL